MVKKIEKNVEKNDVEKENSVKNEKGYIDVDDQIKIFSEIIIDQLITESELLNNEEKQRN